MKKKALLIVFSALATSLASFAGTPENMQVWLKNGEYSVFDINQVDSVTFGTSPQQEYTPLTENTMPPTFAAPIPLELSEQNLAYVKSTNEFGKKCYARLRTNKKENGDPFPIHFFSPVSLNMALGICANGADTVGIKEIAQAMGFPSGNALNALDSMNDFFNKLYLSLNSNVDSVTIRTVDALWFDEQSPVNMNLVKTVKEKYYATVRKLDFRENPIPSKDTIDHWAALMTNDCIKKLGIKIGSNTRLVINNACYFKGNWVTRFTPAGKALFNGTHEADSTEYMSLKGETLEYSEDEYYQAIKLDYGTEANKASTTWGSQNVQTPSAYSMVIVLPKSGHDLNEVLPSIQWDSIPFERMTGSIYMPTFKANGGYDLERLLKDYLGIRTIFEIYPNAVLEENIFISQVRQDYFINVNEEGTEAAAVTSIVASQWGGSGRSFNMYCNRPFAFAIRENRTGLILFMGEYNSVPKAEN
ncbi:MAG: hypothetical protein K6F48_00100 [Paludibacteraceae bacterium]|nr:hypothetical protein [Paludibacteraceae bacterium]